MAAPMATATKRLSHLARHNARPLLGALPTSHHALLSGRQRARFLSKKPASNGEPDLRNTSSHAIPAKYLNHNVSEEEKRDWNDRLEEAQKQREVEVPWHRDHVDEAPADKPRKESVRTKGKLLTTPSRLLKLVLPLQTHSRDQAPLALLLHPQQPLSYLERLIQAEIPFIKDKNGNERIPTVHFRAEDRIEDSIEPKKGTTKAKAVEQEQEDDDDLEQELEPETEESPQTNSAQYSSLDHLSAKEQSAIRGGPGQGGVETYSGAGHEGALRSESARHFVRWSKSTEVGDFIRDAARGREFAVEIEGSPGEVRVGVPSFGDRTHYLRLRLRNTSRKIAKAADIKKECDELAHRGAQRVAFAGFGGLCAWWFLVYQLTFESSYGWDVMEPVTYLAGLSTLIFGYMWFLYHNREASYRSAMKITTSRRQAKLYESRGFDPVRWEALIEEGNVLRREIKAVATEYDVEWDEMEEEKVEKVRKALKEGKRKKEGKGGKAKEEEDDDD